MNKLGDEMGKLSTAEEFLEYFGVNYRQSVVNVNRLHILKRFSQYIGRHQFSAAGEDAVKAEYKMLLERAYQDFVESDAVREKVFKVFHKATGTRLVSIDSLRESLSRRVDKI